MTQMKRSTMVTWQHLRDELLDRPLVMATLGPWTIDPKRMRRPTLRSTQIVIEGYPRSANTFATAAFLYAQGHRGSFVGARIDVANHWHRPCQITLAARWRIPAIALIREPRAAILSNMVYRGSTDARACAGRYISFYKAVAAVRDDVVVVDFTEAISDMGAVISRANARFGTSFRPFEHNAHNVATVQAMIEEHARRVRNEPDPSAVSTEPRFAVPTAEREARKAAIAHLLAEPAMTAPLEEAGRLYGLLTASRPAAGALPGRPGP